MVSVQCSIFHIYPPESPCHADVAGLELIEANFKCLMFILAFKIGAKKPFSLEMLYLSTVYVSLCIVTVCLF